MKSSSMNSEGPQSTADEMAAVTSTGSAESGYQNPGAGSEGVGMRGWSRPTAWPWVLGIYCVWLLALVLLAWTSPAEVVSRSQLGLAAAVLRGRVLPDGNGGWQTQVMEIFKAPPAHAIPGQDGIAVGERLCVQRIDQADGWQGIGEYILPLQPLADQSGWQVAPVPDYFGVLPRRETQRRIYLASAAVVRQVRQTLEKTASAER